MKVKVVSVRCFELFQQDGMSLGLFKVVEKWQGMSLLKHIITDQSIIMDDGTTSLYESMFGEVEKDCIVVKASPDLAVKLQEAT